MKITLTKGTHTIAFNRPYPLRVIIMFNNQLWILRHLDGDTPSIKFNTIAENGDYESNIDFRVLKSEPLQNKDNSIELYKYERNREKPIKIVYNEKLTGTPARIFSNMNPAIIEVSPSFYKYPPQVRMFILLHEYGHLFYETEHKTDLYALKEYLKLGLNASQAFFALAKVLHPSPKSQERIKRLFNELKSNGYVSI